MNKGELMVDTMLALSILEDSKQPDWKSFKENCAKLERMMVQKDAGQRDDSKAKGNIDFDDIYRIKASILCEALIIARSMQ